MADDAETAGPIAPAPVVVEYDPITGVPAEFNEYLPPDSAEFKRWKASHEGPGGLWYGSSTMLLRRPASIRGSGLVSGLISGVQG